ncbi:regulator of G-protein signaling 17-like isoform X2 [Sitophilus oryzae]|uniref:Regulator of G-protein signaling 17-like isoform X2 n=1 Tax=Sitophilus oryzae TaxID=7048 RepID=A0A6J2X4Z7_SITOR|nr:regulator of G-protein signaling 17-like isoform X2 [Sitophilus oryzae]
MSCSITERVSSSAPTTGGKVVSAVSTSSQCRSRTESEALATSPNSRGTTHGAGTPSGTGPPQNGPHSSSPQGPQFRSKPCGSMLLCCCCKCPWSNVGKTGENGKDATVPLQEVRVTMEEIRSWSKSFDTLMKSNGRKVFRNFLKGEYSEENMLFWLACEDFKKHSSKDHIERRAKLIYLHYIHPASSTEVSLDAHVREIIKKHLPDPQQHMYDEAQLQIYTLMQRDSYPRFLSSSVIRSLIQQTEKRGREKVSFWIQPQKTPSLHTIELNEENLEEDHGQASQSTPLLTAAHPAATTPVSDFSDRDQDAS